MASSNRHWPSLFKSKPACSSSPHQWQHDHHPTNHSSLLSSSHCHKPNSYASGSEERTPEPKPRWNPKPEQIRILEGIFNSGMVNPPREEIRRIRSQLQAYGQVGDANVFYWFQNRKSRSKHKQRHLKPPPPNPAAAAAPCSSSPTSSSDVSPSSGSNKRRMILLPPGSGISSATPFELAEAQALFRGPPPPPDELGLEFLAAIPPDGIVGGSNEEAEIWGDIIAHEIGISNSISPGSINMTEVAPPPLIVLPASVNAMISTVDHTPSPVNEIQQAARSTVFINDVAYEVMAGPLNIREAFGGAAVLLHSSGQPVLTDEWGLTLHPLQHGASYYLVQ